MEIGKPEDKKESFSVQARHELGPDHEKNVKMSKAFSSAVEQQKAGLAANFIDLSHEICALRQLLEKKSQAEEIQELEKASQLLNRIQRSAANVIL